MLLMIDNYDSFTYNLVQYFGELGQEVKTFRNDQITIQEIKKLDPALDPKTYGFVEEDMDRKIFLDNVLGLQEASMNQISEIVKKTYCGTFALQYMHISNAEESAWLKERIEGLGKEIEFTQKGRKAILNKLIEAEGFEKFLHVKYMGTKRFGLSSV